MKVSELIAKLQSLPQDAQIESLYDLGCHNSIDFVWLARNGKVYVCRDGEWYGNEDLWPEGAVANMKEPYGTDVTDWYPENIEDKKK